MPSGAADEISRIDERTDKEARDAECTYDRGLRPWHPASDARARSARSLAISELRVGERPRLGLHSRRRRSVRSENQPPAASALAGSGVETVALGRWIDDGVNGSGRADRV